MPDFPTSSSIGLEDCTTPKSLKLQVRFLLCSLIFFSQLQICRFLLRQRLCSVHSGAVEVGYPSASYKTVYADRQNLSPLARRHHQRVLYIDIDIHHGDGGNYWWHWFVCAFLSRYSIFQFQLKKVAGGLHFGAGCSSCLLQRVLYSILHDQPCNDVLFSQVWGVFSRNRRRQGTNLVVTCSHA